jgi:hypothetical protein
MQTVDHLYQVRRLDENTYLDTLGFNNATHASKPTCPPIGELSDCSSQVHSAPALASAHTLPDSLSLA